MGVEADCERPQDSAIFQRCPVILADRHMMEFICDCLRLIVSGNLDPHELECLLEYELETHHREAHQPAHAMQQAADALPGFGIVAAVLGIVNTMAAIEGADTATIGHKVAAALVGTYLNDVPNDLSLSGHTDTTPYAGDQRGYSNWELSADRANAARRALLEGGLDEAKVARVVGCRRPCCSTRRSRPTRSIAGSASS